MTTFFALSHCRMADAVAAIPNLMMISHSGGNSEVCFGVLKGPDDRPVVRDAIASGKRMSWESRADSVVVRPFDRSVLDSGWLIGWNSP